MAPIEDVVLAMSLICGLCFPRCRSFLTRSIRCVHLMIETSNATSIPSPRTTPDPDTNSQINLFPACSPTSECNVQPFPILPVRTKWPDTPKRRGLLFSKARWPKRRRDDPSNPDQDGKPAHLNKVGRLYEKVLTYGTSTRYSIYILPVAIIIMIPTIVGATQVSRTDPKIGGVRLVWFFTWIESVWLSFWGMRFVARCIPVIFRYFASVVSTESKKYGRVLENLRDMITVFGWVIISFVLYEILFETSAAGNTPYGWTKTFKQVLGAILVSTIIPVIEKIFVQLVSVIIMLNLSTIGSMMPNTLCISSDLSLTHLAAFSQCMARNSSKKTT